MEKNSIQKSISDNIKANVIKQYAEDGNELSIKKVINDVKKSFDVDVTEDSLSTELSDVPFVKSLENDQIVLGTEENQDKDNANEEVHDKAVDQIDDHMKFESVADALTAYKVGDIIKSSKIKLNESDEHYHLYYGSKKANRNYIVCEIMPKKKINESYFRCKIEGTALYIHIPIRSLM